MEMPINIAAVFDEAKERMQKSLQDLTHGFGQLRSGRASASLVEDIRVDMYGQQMPLNQVASITIPEPRLIAIDVWDKSRMQDVEKAIQKSGKNLNPQSDGVTIRISLPEMTQETRKEMVKTAKQKCEDHKVAIRNIRRDANDSIKKVKGDGISEDDIKSYQDEIQKLTDSYIRKMDDLFSAKEKDIMNV